MIGFNTLVRLSVVLLFFSTTRLEASKVLEDKLKTAFLFNFAKFIDWPPDSFGSAAEPIVLGYIDDSGIGEIIKQLDGRSINQRHVKVRAITSASEIEGCHIVYFGKKSSILSVSTLHEFDDKPILRIMGNDSLYTSQGIICFVRNENKLSFKVYLDAANHARLRVSAKLLKVAHEVIQERNPSRDRS